MSVRHAVFNPRLVAGLIVAGIAAFTAMLLLMAYGDNLGAGRDGRAHALSQAATGYKGLVTLVGGFHQTRFVRSAEQEGDDLLIVSLEPDTPPDRLRALLARRPNLPTLVILPKWWTVADPEHRGWVRALAPVAGRSQQAALDGADIQAAEGPAPAAPVPGEAALAGIDFPVPAAAQTVSAKAYRPLLQLPGGRSLVAQISDQPHYLLADPDLVNNHGLRDPARARAALALIERLNEDGESVGFDLTMNGFGTGASKSLLRLAFEPPFVAMTLALFAAAVLAGLHGAFRFGPARREARAIAFGKAALVENSAALIGLADREAQLGGAYVEMVREETARTTGAQWLQGDKLDAYLDRLGRPGRPRFSELAAQVRNAHDRPSLMAGARALTLWRKEIIR
jgi:hypothetical protein